MTGPRPKVFAAAIALALLATASPAPGVMAHSLDDFEGELLSRESYVEVMNSPAPAFTFTDAEGRVVSLSDFRDKVVVLYFVYARCKELCPLQNDFLAAIQERINATPLGERVQFVTVVTDSEDARETAQIIRGFPRRHGFDTRNWVVLYRGDREPDATIKLAERYGQKFSYTEDGDQLHGIVTYLIDRQGALRARYHSLYFDPANFIEHASALSDEHRDAPERGEQRLWSKVKELLSW